MYYQIAMLQTDWMCKILPFFTYVKSPCSEALTLIKLLKLTTNFFISFLNNVLPWTLSKLIFFDTVEKTNF